MYLQSSQLSSNNNGYPLLSRQTQVLPKNSSLGLQALNSSLQSDSISFKGGASSAKKLGFFGRFTNAITDAIAHAEGKLAGTKPMQKLIDFLKDKNYQQHIVAATGVALSGFYMADTAKSKTIDKDQKLPLILNQGTVLVASTVGGYTLDNYLSKKLNNFTQTFNIANIGKENVRTQILKMHGKKDSLEKADFEELFKIVKNSQEKRNYNFEKDILESFDYNHGITKQLKAEIKAGKADDAVKKVIEGIEAIPKGDKDKTVKSGELFLKHMKDSKLMKKIFSKQAFNTALKLATNEEKALSQLMTGLKIAKSLMVFGLIYRFVSPVIATPIANHVSAKIEKKKKAAEHK